MSSFWLQGIFSRVFPLTFVFGSWADSFARKSCFKHSLGMRQGFTNLQSDFSHFELSSSDANSEHFCFPWFQVAKQRRRWTFSQSFSHSGLFCDCNRFLSDHPFLSIEVLKKGSIGTYQKKLTPHRNVPYPKNRCRTKEVDHCFSRQILSQLAELFVIS